MIGHSRNEISNRVGKVEEDTTLHCIFGHIIEVIDIDEEDQYIALILPEGTVNSAESYAAIVPIEERPDILASDYGTPQDLIGYRVRIDYYGLDWSRGLAHIIGNRVIESPGNTSEMPARSFRFAVAGGGSI